jgi:hypothetical protein
MSYAVQQALGYDVIIDTPIGQQTVSFDLDKVSADVAQAVADKAWPIAEAKARAALPTFVAQGVEEARPYLHQERDELLRKVTTTGLVLVVSLGLSLAAASWYHKQPAGRPLFGGTG